MNSKELRLLGEAYASIQEEYGKKKEEGELVDEEQLDEAGGPALPGEPGRPGTPKAPGGRPHLPGEKETPAPKKRMSLQLAGVDLFDIVKGHLMSEGYADTEEAALAIMANMSEEWRQSIIESDSDPNWTPSMPNDRSRRPKDTPRDKPQNPSPGSAPAPRDQPKDTPMDKPQNPTPGSAPAPRDRSIGNIPPRRGGGSVKSIPPRRGGGKVEGNTNSPGTIGTIERGKPGDGYLGPTINIPTPFGNTTFGIPNPNPFRINRK